tara:strand:+ start:149 stop:436 length:288 start_codon:yes stop_codon:yes gene_type:complete
VHWSWLAPVAAAAMVVAAAAMVVAAAVAVVVALRACAQTPANSPTTTSATTAVKIQPLMAANLVLTATTVEPELFRMVAAARMEVVAMAVQAVAQ